MTDSKTNAMSRKEVLAAVRSLPPSQDFVWDGVDEDDRPAMEEALRTGNANALPDQGVRNKSPSASTGTCQRFSAPPARVGRHA